VPSTPAASARKPSGSPGGESNKIDGDSLHAAVRWADPAEVSRLLDAGADVNERRGPLGLTPLMVAATVATGAGRAGGDADAGAEMISLLLERGADASALAANGAGALARAVVADNGAGARLLLDAGADPNGSGAGASGAGAEAPPNTSPLWAAVALRRATLVRLLLDHGAEANTGDSTYGTPFTVAVVGGDVGIARMLLEAGADPRRPSRVNLPLLAVAMVLRDPPMARLLEEYGLSLALAPEHGVRPDGEEHIKHA